jgi:hypothetical protein
MSYLHGKQFFSDRFNVVDHADATQHPALKNISDVTIHFDLYKKLLTNTDKIPILYAATDMWMEQFVPLLEELGIQGVTNNLGPLSNNFKWIPHWLVAVDLDPAPPTTKNIPRYRWQYWVRKNRIHRTYLLEKMLEMQPKYADIVYLKRWNNHKTVDDFKNKKTYKTFDRFVHKPLDIRPGENGAYVPAYERRQLIGLDVITETYQHSSIGEVFVSEKTYRPLRAGQLFLLQGPCYAVDEIRNLGFDTFDKWIDHSYDNETDVTKRTNLLFEELRRIENMSNTEWEQLWVDTYPERMYNQTCNLQSISDWYVK